MELILAMAVFGGAMAAMSIGVAGGRYLRGSCGGAESLGPDGEPLGCGACPRKEAEVCPSDDPVVAAARLGYPGLDRR